MNAKTALLGGALLTLLVATTACGSNEEAVTLAPGQVWQYQTRQYETESRLTVCKVEQHETLGEIVHVHLDRLAIPSDDAPEGVMRTISHAPFLAGSLRGSLVALETTRTELPDFEAGYGLWQEANEYGEAFVYSLPVADSLDGLERLLVR